MTLDAKLLIAALTVVLLAILMMLIYLHPNRIRRWLRLKAEYYEKLFSDEKPEPFDPTWMDEEAYWQSLK